MLPRCASAPIVRLCVRVILSSDLLGCSLHTQVKDGDNVVLFANHQSEADPQIFSVLLDPKYPGFAEQTIFVAGDRVTTDLLAGPFSMGRNLLCIFSKKHIENPPELKSEKCVLRARPWPQTLPNPPHHTPRRVLTLPAVAWRLSPGRVIRSRRACGCVTSLAGRATTAT